MSRPHNISRFMLTGAILAAGSLAVAHGDVSPQAVDTAGLPEVGEEWLTENPYRVEAAGEGDLAARDRNWSVWL